MAKNILDDQGPPQMAVLQDGTEIRLVPLHLTGNKLLYVDVNGNGYSYVRGQFRHLIAVTERRGYLQFRRYHNIKVSHAVLEAWEFPRPKGYECDHLNGNSLDNRVENLQWVTHQENMRRRKVLYNCKGLGFNGQPMKRQLIQLEINFKESPTAALPLTNT